MADFKITYKGNSLVIPFDYKCYECGDISVIEQKRSDDMNHRICEKCGGKLSRYITSAPMLDADYHESHLARNIGWSSE